MEEKDVQSNNNLDLESPICQKTNKTIKVLWYLWLASATTLGLFVILGLSVPMLKDKEVLMGLSVLFGCLVWVGIHWIAHFSFKNIWRNPKT